MMENMTKNSKKLLYWVLIILIIILPSVSFADDDEEFEFKKEEKKYRIEFGGHATTLWTFLNDRTSGIQNTLNTNRLRLETKFFAGEKFSFKFINDLEASTGNFVSSSSWDQFKNPQQNSYWNLSWGFKPGRAIYFNNSIYRVYATYDMNFAQIAAGKQRIAWGVMRFWRPTDMLNTESPLQVEPGEIQGLDSVLLKTDFSDKSSLEGVYAPSKVRGSDITAGRFAFSMGNYDFTLMGGKIRHNKAIGFTFDGYIGEGGFRGEIVRIVPQPILYSNFKKPYYQYTLGGDYSFPNALTLTIEYLNNGGATGKQVNPFVATQGHLVTKNQNFIGLGATYKISPLIRFDGFLSYDIDKKSYALAPRIYWDYKKNIDLSLGTMIFGGKEGGEYTNTPNIIFTQVKYYF